MSTPLTTDIPQRHLLHKQSSRHLLNLHHLSSSEATPSEHSSLYDASPLSPSSEQNHGYSWSSDGEDGDVPLVPKNVQGREQAMPSQHIGTKLFTIIEQKSVPSLKTFRLQPQLSSDMAQARHSRMAQRRCYSADDSSLPISRTKGDPSDGASAEANSEWERPDAYTRTTLPIQPPYRVPERMQTPTGLPRWPGERNHEQRAVNQLTVKTSRRDLLRQFLRAPASRPSIKEVLRGARTITLERPARTGERFWRPPSSGHTTRRFEGLETHPFSFVPIAKPNRVAVGESSLTNAGPSLQGSGDVVWYPRSVRDSTNGQPYAMSDSLRALRDATQNSVAVPLSRVSAQASIRSVAVPLHIRTPPSVDHSQCQTSQSLDTGTVRTVDLVDSFPAPPGEQRVQPHKRSSWSLFPVPDPQEDAHERPSALQRRRAAALSDESEASNVAIRGENQARYRHSGTPIYDSDCVSLRTLDRSREHSHEDGIHHSGSTTTTHLPRTESQRAISNGALLFSTRLEIPIPDASRTYAQAGNSENQIPTSGGTLREVPELPHLCKHKLAKLHSFQKKHPDSVSDNQIVTLLDGTSTPMPPPPILAQDYALAGPSISTRARASIAPAQQIERPPTTTTFVTAPNGATTFTTIPTMGPLGRSTTLASAQTESTMPGRA